MGVAKRPPTSFSLKLALNLTCCSQTSAMPSLKQGRSPISFGGGVGGHLTIWFFTAAVIMSQLCTAKM